MELFQGREADERSLQFLTEFRSYKRSLHEKKILSVTKDIGMAVYHTSRGLVGVTRHLLASHTDKLYFALLDKIQHSSQRKKMGDNSDPLRKLSGENHLSSVRKYFENEMVIRIKSLIWWLGYSPAYGDLQPMPPTPQEREHNDLITVSQLSLTAACKTEPEEPDDGSEAALRHIAG